MAGSAQAINIVLDGPPDLTAGSGRFVEVETDDGHSIAIGAWIQRSDGYGSLRIDGVPIPQQPSTTTRQTRRPTVTPPPKKRAGPIDVELTHSVETVPRAAKPGSLAFEPKWDGFLH